MESDKVNTEANKAYSRHVMRERINKYPWMSHFYSARERCKPNRKGKKYKYYAERGIKFLLTKQEMEFLWLRDKAYEQPQTSIDRINPDGDYTLSNCRFIEIGLNRKTNRGKIKKGYDKRRIPKPHKCEGRGTCSICGSYFRAEAVKVLTFRRIYLVIEKALEDFDISNVNPIVKKKGSAPVTIIDAMSQAIVQAMRGKQ